MASAHGQSVPAVEGRTSCWSRYRSVTICARRSPISEISCFISKSGKKCAIQLTNAFHRSFTENWPPTILSKYDCASARVKV